MLRKVNVPGLEAVDSFIDFGLQAYNVYTNVTNKFAALKSPKYILSLCISRIKLTP